VEGVEAVRERGRRQDGDAAGHGGRMGWLEVGGEADRWALGVSGTEREEEEEVGRGRLSGPEEWMGRRGEETSRRD
jgi:hypothetical protein